MSKTTFPTLGHSTKMTASGRWATLKSLALAGAALVVLVAGTPSAQADTLADVKAAGVLKTGTEMQFPPFDMIEGGEYIGLNRDLIDEVGKEMGLKVEYQDLPWTSVLPGLEAGKFDLVIAPVTITKERMERYGFTVPIANATAAMMKKTGDDSIMKPEDIVGKTVGGGKGTSQLAQAKEYAETLGGDVSFNEYVDSNQSYADLAAGRVDVSVNSLPNLSYAASQRPETFTVVLPPFGNPTYFSWVTRKGEGDESLREAVNAALVAISADGRMAKIQEKWLGQSVDLPSEVPAPSF
jgi:polar amino acid transport system substrate-binding protein